MTDQDATPDTARSSMAQIFGYALGAAVPMAAFGKAAMAPFLLVAFALALWISVSHRDGTRVRFEPAALVRQPILWLFGFWFVSALLSFDIQKSLETLVRTLALVGLGALFCVTAAKHTAAQGAIMRATVAVTLFVCAVISVLLILEVSGTITPGSTFVGIALDPAQRFKSFGAVTVCLIPLCLWFGSRLGGKWKAAGLFSLPLAAIVLTGAGRQPSLDGMLGIIGGVALLLTVAGLVHLPTLPRRALGIASVIGATGLFLWVCLNLPSIPVGPEPAPALPVLDWHRQVIWGFAVDVFSQNWVFGVGPNVIDLAEGARDMIPGMRQEYIPGHPHNWLFEVMAETGLLGTVAIAATLLSLLIELGRRAARHEPGAWAAIFLCGAFWTSALSNFSIWAAWWQACFIVLIGIALALTRKANTTP